MNPYPEFRDIYAIKRDGRYLGDDEDGAPRYAQSHWADILNNHDRWETGGLLIHYGKDGRPDEFAVRECARTLAFRFPYTEEGYARALRVLKEVYEWQDQTIAEYIEGMDKIINRHFEGSDNQGEKPEEKKK
jgi:hypothetical protein